MILIINVCKENMHYHEFVRPIEDIIKGLEMPFVTKRYEDVKKEDIESCHRIIITGTSLKDNEYAKHLSRFRFLKDFQKPVLGICAGMQILCSVNGCKLARSTEIGLEKIHFSASFLGVQGEREVYMLHKVSIADDDELHKNFHIYAKSMGRNIQAVRHKRRKHYGILFHPEVRNKDMVSNFLNE